MVDDHFSSMVSEPLLVDYWIVVLRRWKLLVIVTLLVTTASIWYGFNWSPLPHPYRTVIEVSDANASISKIQQVYLPIVLEEDAQREGYVEQRYGVTVSGAGNIVALESYGSEASSVGMLRIQQRVASLLIEDEKRSFEKRRREFARVTFQKELERDVAKSQDVFVANKFQRIIETTKLLDQQIAAMKKSVDTTEQKKQVLITNEAQRQSNAESVATTLILLENDLQKTRETLSGLEERRAISLKVERDAVEVEQLQNQRRRQEIQKDLEQLQYEQSNIKEARVLMGPARFLRTTKAGQANVTIYAIIAGLFAGFFAVFFAEFHRHAILRLRQLNQ